MCGEAPLRGPVVSVRVPCGSLGCAFGPRRRRLGWLTDAADEVAWPILARAAAWAARRLTRDHSNRNAEADPIG